MLDGGRGTLYFIALVVESIPRVPECMPHRRNWFPPTPSSESECAPVGPSLGLKEVVLFLERVYFLILGGAAKLRWEGGAQRPVRHGNEPKKTGARSARARTRGQKPLVEYKHSGFRVFGNAVHAAGVGKETGELAEGTIPLRHIIPERLYGNLQNKCRYVRYRCGYTGCITKYIPMY